MEVRKKEENTPSTKGKSLFSLLFHPRSSMDSTTKAQSLQNKPSVPSFYQGRLHKDCWTTTSEGQESLWESRHCSSSHSTLGTLLYSQSVGSQGKDYPFNSLIQDQNIDLSSWKAPKKKKKKGKKGTPKATCFLLMNTNSQKSIFLSDTDCRIEDINKKKGIYAQDFTKY